MSSRTLLLLATVAMTVCTAAGCGGADDADAEPDSPELGETTEALGTCTAVIRRLRGHIVEGYVLDGTLLHRYYNGGSNRDSFKLRKKSKNTWTNSRGTITVQEWGTSFRVVDSELQRTASGTCS